MQALRFTAAGVHNATDSFAVRTFSFTHTAPASAVIGDGAGREIGRVNIGPTSGGADGYSLPSTLLIAGLQVISITAGAILFVYVE